MIFYLAGCFFHTYYPLLQITHLGYAIFLEMRNSPLCSLCSSVYSVFKNLFGKFAK